MSPAPGHRLVRHVGDTLCFSLQGPNPARPEHGWQARLRTNLGRGTTLRGEIVEARTRSVPPFGASWHDVPLLWNSHRQHWTREFVLAEPGYFSAKAYLVDPDGFQHWPQGPDFGVAVHPDWCRTANILYCAFTRLLGSTRSHRTLLPEPNEPLLRDLEQRGHAVLPPSGTFRDLTRLLPHIVSRLGCRILHLLPIHPTPTVHARFGRMGSPYAALDLTAVDPALVEFDRRTTGVEQFVELTRAAHGLGARVFIDIVINHTGWGSRLFEEHPEFFRRESDGQFACPGAWGVTWEDLVELEQDDIRLWETIAESLLVWCRRGVDGFRCDAGYKVPVQVWQYITARVTAEFPDAVFLLEGLGGAWEATERLLGDGGMQWAYSELFQNYNGDQIQTYLDYALQRSETTGTYIHYSETHDNERLAARGRNWSLLRNRICALTSVKGGFGFTSGVEWLATEKIRVHQRTGLAWDAPENLVDELATLNRLLANHPAFFDNAKLRRLSPPGSPVFALLRTDAEASAPCLVLVNSSTEHPESITLPLDLLPHGTDWIHDLLGQPTPIAELTHDARRFRLPPSGAFCLGHPDRLSPHTGLHYRAQRARIAFALQSATALLPAEALSPFDTFIVENAIERNPTRWLSQLSAVAQRLTTPGHPPTRLDLARLAEAPEALDAFPNVVPWTTADATRVTPIPPGWWLVLVHDTDFRAHLELDGESRVEHRTSIPTTAGHLVAFPPRSPNSSTEATLCLEDSGPIGRTTRARALFLSDSPSQPRPFDPDGVVLLTNDRGGMARLRIDFGSIQSKYDCALAANLHPHVPVDRHVLVKRVRAWLDADGFISPLDRHNLVDFATDRSARWSFRANAGDGRVVTVSVEAHMVPGSNRTRFTFTRAPSDLPLPASITLRVDLEDRSFHSETHRNPAADHHFQSHTHALTRPPGFRFQPAPDRAVQVTLDAGRYHPQPEWSEHVPHTLEASRGQTASGDAYSPGWFGVPLAPGQSVTLDLNADPANSAGPNPPPAPALPEPAIATPTTTPHVDPLLARLEAAASAFLVRRDGGRTVIAGYPWFLDWGRDTLIAARGYLAAGRTSEVVEILHTFARFADHGTLPNSIHGDNASNRDTSDAPLWFAVVVDDAARRLGPTLLATPIAPAGPTLLEVVRDIANGYLAGTPNGIHVDPDSALVWSPSHFTWMDTNHPPGTPREGYPVEIQALWIRTLRFLGQHATESTTRWMELARTAQSSFERLFWLPEQRWLADVLLGSARTPAAQATPDTALRCNQLLPVTWNILPADRARDVVHAALRHLLVPGAVRSLAPLRVSPPLPIRGTTGHLLNNPDFPYWGRYEGDEDTRRKPAYHNGTAWGWFLPILAEALLVAWDRRPEAQRAATAILRSTETLLDSGCVGHLPEVLDGDAPHLQRGCDAQAWSVTEAIRVWKRLYP